jgi:hypothetical protein
VCDFRTGSFAALTTIWITRAAAITLASGAIGMPLTESTPFVPSFFYGAKSMLKFSKAKLSILTLALALNSGTPSLLGAEETIENAGVALGVTAGNMWFIPIKAISVSMGALSGALSFVVTGGNLDLTNQIWRDTVQGPYVITPELARKAIGDRPELSEAK